jgi:outer membrane protein
VKCSADAVGLPMLSNLSNSRQRRLQMNKLKSLGFLSVITILFSTIFILGMGTANQGVYEYAVVDTQRILAESRIGKQAQGDLEAFKQQSEQRMKTMQENFKRRQQEMQERSATATQQEMENMQKQIQDEAVTLRRAYDDLNRELQKLSQKKLQEMEKMIMPVITEYARQQGLKMVFNKFDGGLVYADDSIDITSTIIYTLDNR